MISAHGNLHLLGSSHSSALSSRVAEITGIWDHAQLIFILLIEPGFHHVNLAVLKLLTSGDLPTSVSQSAMTVITGVNNCAQQKLKFKKICNLQVFSLSLFPFFLFSSFLSFLETVLLYHQGWIALA